MKLLSQKLAGALGLSQYESRVFLALHGFEKGNISEIAKASSIPRTAIYPAIKSLTEKGLISIVISGKRKYYKALSPKQLETIFDWRRKDLNVVINELSKGAIVSEEPMEVLYFPGKKGLNSAAEVFLDSTKCKLWKTFENSVVNQPALEFYQLQDYIDRRVKKRIKAKVIMTLNLMYPFLKERLDKDKEELRETLLIADKLFSFKAVLGVNENSILILSGEEIVFGAVIKNQQIAQTLSSIHDIVWNRYKSDKS